MFSHPEFADWLLRPGSETESGMEGMKWKFSLLQTIFITYSQGRRREGRKGKSVNDGEGGGEEEEEGSEMQVRDRRKKKKKKASWLSSKTWDDVVFAVRGGPFRGGHKTMSVATKRA